MKKILIALFVLFPTLVVAYGPFHICPSGTGGIACKWPNNRIIWKYDPGPLSATIPATTPSANSEFCSQPFRTDNPCQVVDRCGAVACVDWLFRRWAESSMIMADGRSTIRATNLTIVNGGPMELTDGDTDINIENSNNYLKYIDRARQQGIVLVIFDNDGRIIERETEGLQSSVLGISNPYLASGSNFYNGGAAIFNGLFVDGNNGNREVSYLRFAATMAHELGHGLGLDHSQPLREAIGSSTGTARDPLGVPTMYPKLVDEAQLDLHEDDVIGIGYLYPSTDFTNRLCTIRGNLLDEDSRAYQGVNVIAHVDLNAEKLIDERSFVSGALFPGGTANGEYTLSGIVPCKPYKVVAEAIFRDFQQYAGGLNPYSDTFNNGPSEADVDSDVLTAGNGAAGVIVCDPDNSCGTSGVSPNYSVSAGVQAFRSSAREIRMDPSNLRGDIEEQRSESPATTTSQRRGWCMSVAGDVNPLWGTVVFVLVGGLFIIRRRFA